jgi:hypothetical protein
VESGENTVDNDGTIPPDLLLDRSLVGDRLAARIRAEMLVQLEARMVDDLHALLTKALQSHTEQTRHPEKSPLRDAGEQWGLIEDAAAMLDGLRLAMAASAKDAAAAIERAREARDEMGPCNDPACEFCRTSPPMTH